MTKFESKYRKLFREEFEKHAQDPKVVGDVPSPTGAPPPAVRGGPPPTGSGGMGDLPPGPYQAPAPPPPPPASYGQISDMQKAIQEFATATVNYRTTPKMENGKVVKTVNQDDKRRDFNDFLAEQFSASADIHGSEYTTDASATSEDSKQPTDLVQLNNVIDGLQRIGPGQRETLRDGVWDFRTNNAVRNTYAIATALVAANEALGGTASNDKSVFRRNDLEALGKSIPQQKDPYKEGVSQAELGEKAKGIAPLVRKLTDFYKFYSTKIMDHPHYRRYIEGNLPLFTVTPGGGDPAQLDDNQKKQLQENGQKWTLFNLTLPNKEGKNVDLGGQVSLNYLVTRRALQQLMIQKLGYTDAEINNWPLMIQLVQSMLGQVTDYISKHKPLPVPPKPQQQTGDQVAPQAGGRNQIA